MGQRNQIEVRERKRNQWETGYRGEEVEPREGKRREGEKEARKTSQRVARSAIGEYEEPLERKSNTLSGRGARGGKERPRESKKCQGRD